MTRMGKIFRQNYRYDRHRHCVLVALWLALRTQWRFFLMQHDRNGFHFKGNGASDPVKADAVALAIHWGLDEESGAAAYAAARRPDPKEWAYQIVKALRTEQVRRGLYVLGENR